MAGRASSSFAKTEIVSYFRDRGPAVYRKSELEALLQERRSEWRLGTRTTAKRFIADLLKATDLREVVLEFPAKSYGRYVWGACDPFEVVQSLDSEGYFSHYSALRWHDLTEQIPSAVYFNREQRLSGGGGRLSQAAIDAAFRRKCRVTHNVASYTGLRIHLLNGGNTGRLGVEAAQLPSGRAIQVTGIERTLIDIVVRPGYSGGIYEAAKAYERAAGRMSTNRLVAMLNTLGYTYPYHQAIGFLLQRAGASPEQLAIVKTLPIAFDFYLDYELQRTRYIAEWRLHVPEGM